MVFAQTHSLIREVISLLLGIFGVGAAIFVYLMKNNVIQLVGATIPDEQLLWLVTGLLVLSGAMLLINTVGAITHIWRNN
jgi:hypothetical protein